MLNLLQKQFYHTFKFYPTSDVNFKVVSFSLTKVMNLNLALYMRQR